MMKKNARTRRGRLRPNSVQRSETFTPEVCALSITTFSSVWLKQKKSSARAASEYTIIVRNQALPSAGIACSPTSSEPLAKSFTQAGMPIDTARPPRFAINILVEVNMVISFVSLVREEFRAP